MKKSFLTTLFVTTVTLLSSLPANAHENHHGAVKLLPGLDKQQIRFADVEPLIQRVQRSSVIETKHVGTSYQGRPLYRFKVGQGDTVVFMWSQMHGDESTATPALFDLMQKIETDARWREHWEDDITLYMLPMVNPDGAELAQRYNVQGIDVNRDARALQTPEGRILMAQGRELNPDFGFNLHDQSRYYEVGNTGKPATISLLAPAFNHAKDINDERRRAMQLIGDLKAVGDKMIPGHMGRYNDTFAPRAFGDNFAAMGISTILIESGAFPNDPNRQKARAVNVAMLIRAIDSIASGDYQAQTLEPYHSIPMNNSNSFKDVILEQVQVQDGAHEYRIDIGINRSADARHSGYIRELGDLSVFPAFDRYAADAYVYQAGKGFAIPDEGLTLSHHEYLKLLKQGYTHFTGNAEALELRTHLPVLVNPNNLPGARPQQRQQATFLLRKQDQVAMAVLAGVVINLQ
ncbi:M14 family metallopeptidase [Pseudidiomarina insulisalsae]|uniref:Peptidase M14 n=1 Tax=Pseudidiomarina insulisalsae TaxID=575789 RepID=A0A432YMI2_9GAMM|nr:M14 metallopeptidase family protein [Pseudidiomarina insulisalsae]RUO62199.1 peptidase M14 [Pseudidiomarina insulisalsae]